MHSDSTPLYPQVYPKVDKMQPMEGSHNAYAMQPTAPPPAIPHRNVLLGPSNTVTTCPLCNASIRTAVKYTTNTRTHIAAALCCFICCMCCIPYCSDSARNADHYCPSCDKYIGTYEK